jgi:hypothetical protein
MHAAGTGSRLLADSFGPLPATSARTDERLGVKREMARGWKIRTFVEQPRKQAGRRFIARRRLPRCRQPSGAEQRRAYGGGARRSVNDGVPPIEQEIARLPLQRIGGVGGDNEQRRAGLVRSLLAGMPCEGSRVAFDQTEPLRQAAERFGFFALGPSAIARRHDARQSTTA